VTDHDLGPIDYLALEFPGAKLSGEGLAALVDLVDRGIIRILDLRFLQPPDPAERTGHLRGGDRDPGPRGRAGPRLESPAQGPAGGARGAMTVSYPSSREREK
jgi:hypothetical protein